MKKTVMMIVLCLLCSPALSTAQTVTQAVAAGEGERAIGQLVEIRGAVQAVNLETREVTLKTEEGEVLTIEAGEEARNLDQLVIGDQVLIQYYEQLTLLLEKVEGMPAQSEQVAMDRAEKGEKPGGIKMREMTITAKVVAIDTEASTATLTGPEGNSLTLDVDPEKLAKVKVGDMVSAVYHEALAVSVKAVPAQKPAKE